MPATIEGRYGACGHRAVFWAAMREEPLGHYLPRSWRDRLPRPHLLFRRACLINRQMWTVKSLMGQEVGDWANSVQNGRSAPSSLRRTCCLEGACGGSDRRTVCFNPPRRDEIEQLIDSPVSGFRYPGAQLDADFAPDQATLKPGPEMEARPLGPDRAVNRGRYDWLQWSCGWAAVSGPRCEMQSGRATFNADNRVQSNPTSRCRARVRKNRHRRDDEIGFYLGAIPRPPSERSRITLTRRRSCLLYVKPRHLAEEANRLDRSPCYS